MCKAHRGYLHHYRAQFYNHEYLDIFKQIQINCPRSNHWIYLWQLTLPKQYASVVKIVTCWHLEILQSLLGCILNFIILCQRPKENSIFLSNCPQLGIKSVFISFKGLQFKSSFHHCSFGAYFWFIQHRPLFSGAAQR